MTTHASRAVMTVIIERVPTHRPLTEREMQVIELLDAGLTREECAVRLGIASTTIRFHTEEAAMKIPGDLAPPRFRAVVWFRGAPRHVLEGSATRERAAKLREAVKAALPSLSPLPKR